MKEAVSIKNLSHCFGKKEVLDHIDLAVAEGEIFGLLGPSGAGKTTLINILTGQLNPTGGECFLFGKKATGMTAEDNRRIGIMMDSFGLYERMSCYDNLKFFRMLDGNGRGKQQDAEIDAVLDSVGLREAKKVQVMELSKGMKNRLAFARAILRKPRLLFLDEPTSGLDPMTIEAIYQMILEEKKRGATIFLTTHNMHEAEKLCDRIALLNEGKIVEQGAPGDICRKYYRRKQFLLRLTGGEELVLEGTRENGGLIGSYIENGTLETIHSAEPNLETVFIALTGRTLDR